MMCAGQPFGLLEGLASDGSDPALSEGVRKPESGQASFGPGDLASFWCGVDVVVFEDLPHGCLCDLMAEAEEFAVDSSVAPCRVLGGEVHDQPAHCGGGWWSAGSRKGWLCPVSGDAPPVPAEQCLERHDPALAASAGERRGHCAEQGSVLVVDVARSLWRRNTASWWRRTMISRSLERPERTARRANAAKNKYRMRNTRNKDGGQRRWSAPTREFPSPTRDQARRKCWRATLPMHLDR